MPMKPGCAILIGPPVAVALIPFVLDMCEPAILGINPGGNMLGLRETFWKPGGGPTILERCC